MYLQLIASPVYQVCEQLFCFVSLPDEPQTERILRHGLAHGKQVAVPRCLPKRQMVFQQLSPNRPLSAQLESGTYGVLEPLSDLPPLTPNAEKRTLCLVPGLAFDRKGGRLGYGAGYYDRYLEAYPFLLKIGYAPSAFVVDCVPTEPTDWRLDGIATEYPLEVWNGEKRYQSK